MASQVKGQSSGSISTPVGGRARSARAFAATRVCSPLPRSNFGSDVHRYGRLPRLLTAALTTGVILLCLCAAAGSAFANSAPSFEFDPVGAIITNKTSAGPFKVNFRSIGETKWSVEYSTTESGPWQAVPGGSGSILPGVGGQVFVEGGELTGLTPETTYYLRARIENGSEPAVEPVYASGKFETLPLRPLNGGCKIEKFAGASATADCTVLPEGSETSWRVEYATSQKELEEGNGTVAAKGTVTVAEAEVLENNRISKDDGYYQTNAGITGLLPETVYYVGIFAENEFGVAQYTISHTPEQFAQFETGGRPSVATFSAHAIQGDALRALGSVEPHGFDTHFHVEYVNQEQFAESGWADAESAPPLDAGTTEFNVPYSTWPTELVGEDLPGLHAGKTYHYRLVATSAYPGNPVVDGNEQTLTVPTPGPAGEASCPNEQLRTGFSAALPDCRAYELLTPTDKEGAMDIGTYGNLAESAHVGEDGGHLMYTAPGTAWGESSDSKASTYYFTRTSGGWKMSSVTPQPEAAGESYEPAVFTPDLTQAVFAVGWTTSQTSESPNVEFKAGPPGGPYATVAVAPRADESALSAESADGSKLILMTKDYDLLGSKSGTTSGYDIYEFSEGALSQVNVNSEGKKLGVCGATPAQGQEDFEIENGSGYIQLGASTHAVSNNGARIFFEAIPGGGCSGPPNLYLRENGRETVDIGQYTFLAANPEGSEVLLEKTEGATHEIFLYNVGEASKTRLLAMGKSLKRESGSQLMVAESLDAFYFYSTEQLTPEAPPDLRKLYREDVRTGKLRFIAQALEDHGTGGGYYVSADGQDYYFASYEVAGVPGGGLESTQTYRYDNAEDVIQCMSCASPSDAEPKLNSYFLYGKKREGGGPLNVTIASENGDYVFFDSDAELVSRDIDGEIPPDPTLQSEHVEFTRSPSSDTYEWRRNGVDGCARIEGCLSLISGGTGGYRTELLGASRSGEDVFFVTHEALVAQDTDQAGDNIRRAERWRVSAAAAAAN